jgi:hypothetical protein
MCIDNPSRTSSWGLSDLNVFIVHTVFQEYLIRKTFDFKFKNKNVIIISDLNRNNFLGLSENILYLFVEGSTKCRYRGSWESIKVILTKLDREIRGRTFNLYYSQIEYPLANAIVFRYKTIATLVNYPEGVCNIVPTEFSCKEMIRRFLKCGLGPLFGGRFWPFIGSIDGARYAASLICISGLPITWDAGRRGVNTVEIPKRNFEIPSDNVLVLGLPLEDGAIFIDVCYTIEKVLRLHKGCKKTYYKPHPRESSDMTNWCNLNGLEILDKALSVEVLVETLKPSLIIGFGSSALLTLRLICSSSVEIYSYIPKKMYIKNSKRMGQIKNVFEQVGVSFTIFDPVEEG